MQKMLDQLRHNVEHSNKRRYACAHCGKTWTEIVGIFAGKVDGKEDTYFQFGKESEVCQNCKFRNRTCPACGSNDAYEINLPKSTNLQLSFENIRIVNT